jgi:hypothetical protein
MEAHRSRLEVLRVDLERKCSLLFESETVHVVPFVERHSQIAIEYNKVVGVLENNSSMLSERVRSLLIWSLHAVEHQSESMVIVLLGLTFYLGTYPTLLPQSISRSLIWLEFAQQQKCTEADVVLSEIFREDFHLSTSAIKSFQCARMCASKSNYCQWTLGVYYLFGFGVSPNLNLAVQAFEKLSAGSGHVQATNLAKIMRRQMLPKFDSVFKRKRTVSFTEWRDVNLEIVAMLPLERNHFKGMNMRVRERYRSAVKATIADLVVLSQLQLVVQRFLPQPPPVPLPPSTPHPSEKFATLLPYPFKTVETTREIILQRELQTPELGNEVKCKRLFDSVCRFACVEDEVDSWWDNTKTEYLIMGG